MSGPFVNPQDSGSKYSDSHRYGPNQEYFGGLGSPDGLGHGHRNPNNGFERPPVSDFLGNIAVRGAGGQLGEDQRHTPRW